MDTGMLWYDNDAHTSLTVKIERAADYYHKKYGETADTCLINSSSLGDGESKLEKKVGKVVVRANHSVLPGHFLIGKENKS